LFNISIKSAGEIVRLFYQKYSALSGWIEQIIKEARRYRKITNCFGRTRHFPVYGAFRPEWEREARNFIPQSTIADLTLRSMVRIYNKLDFDKCRILLNVHDSICFEVKTEYVEECIKHIREIMEQPIPVINLSIPTDITISECWWGTKKSEELV